MSEEEEIGPLRFLVGTWQGEKGVDIAPEQGGGTEENLYSETITIEKVGDLKNAGEQQLGMVRYLQIVKRKSNGEVIVSKLMSDKLKKLAISSQGKYYQSSNQGYRLEEVYNQVNRDLEKTTFLLFLDTRDIASKVSEMAVLFCYVTAVVKFSFDAQMGQRTEEHCSTEKSQKRAAK